MRFGTIILLIVTATTKANFRDFAEDAFGKVEDSFVDFVDVLDKIDDPGNVIAAIIEDTRSVIDASSKAIETIDAAREAIQTIGEAAKALRIADERLRDRIAPFADWFKSMEQPNRLR